MNVFPNIATAISAGGSDELHLLDILFSQSSAEVKVGRMQSFDPDVFSDAGNPRCRAIVLHGSSA